MEGSPSLFPTFSQLGAKLKQAIELNFDSTFRKQFSDCKLRVFSLANRKDELDRETRNMAALLAKFRIDFSSVLVIPGRLSTPYNGKHYHGICSDVTKRASEESRSKLNAKLAELPAGTIPEVLSYTMSSFVRNMCLFQEELATNKEKTNRHLRLSELLQEHSSAAELIVMCAIFIFSLNLLSCSEKLICEKLIFTLLNGNV